MKKSSVLNKPQIVDLCSSNVEQNFGLTMEDEHINLKFLGLIYKCPELKTIEWDILNPKYLIGVPNGHNFDFLLNPLFFGYPAYCYSW